MSANEEADLRRQVEELTLERDEMRRANVTPEDTTRPLGQSVEYWQDRCLDHATHLDRARLRIAGLERQAKALEQWVEDWRPYLSSDVIRSINTIFGGNA